MVARWGPTLCPHAEQLPRVPSLMDGLPDTHLLHPPASQSQLTQGLLRSTSQAKRAREFLRSCVGAWAWVSGWVMGDVILGCTRGA